MNSAYMCYYEHLAKLSQVANKQTLFLAHVLYRMEWNSDARQYVAYLTPAEKKSIINEIGSDTKNNLRLAGQYIKTLTNAGLIKSAGGGAYVIDPTSFSGHKYVSKGLRQRNGIIYETRVFTENEGKIEQAYIVTEDGERIDLA